MAHEGQKVSLTGIKPTGDAHLGNYIGAIRPALEMASTFESLYFIADYHALTSVRDRAQMASWTRSVAATWITLGLDPKQTIFYRQSDIPEVFELQWVLSCVTGKGLMNRAHAYKAARDRNAEAGVADLDAGINMGLFNYPVLMAVDILIMNADVVPVGQDQIQHLEYAADIAGSFNHLFGDVFSLKIPEAVTPPGESGRVLPGLDGRKMSKSYQNTIPLFAPESRLRKLVRSIKSDSTPVEAPKDPDSSAAFQLYENFATSEDVADMRGRLEAGGTGWGELKNALFEELNAQLSPLRERYEELMAPDSEIDTILAEGAERARERAQPVLAGVRRAVGIDRL
ncbi:tryptophan--tRNA ligase [Frankia sp. CNm7]|uniref:Tryptophan--tRNA ligase n=1 Tax=Frankia nepalensis TaxID=1836974 RepID=A0A937US45_9ACTN|nr:tryptophan--tRNA ligase [Frankia nepalensis]MBL7495974.1 tryptophan--tRNA ligase [Frankia nepalensis]MBL7513331.1 tryptophan--tRNA ligase [Frankia nepalensis]MBL7517610.1 tryptophan--tRNA ligase [Frankia nepalensis]MBL7633479.1 tryptophan--tRNA ligase [Frankia nepalensis]